MDKLHERSTGRLPEKSGCVGHVVCDDFGVALVGVVTVIISE